MRQSDREAVVAALRDHERFVVTSHDNPDGDAVGSLLATHLGLEALGKDTVMVLGGPSPLPGEYGFLRLESRGLLREAPADVAERVLVAVDCAQESRIVEAGLHAEPVLTVNVDHHHDNTRFGDVNLVVEEASSTAEVLADVFADLRIGLTPPMAEALYTGLVTDTGRFQYSNTTPKALRLAAELVEAGADVHRVFQGIYENVAFAKLKLLARALERAEVLEGGRVIVSHLEREDFERAGAEEPFSEGIIDFLRAVEGAEIAALIRQPPTLNGPGRRVSLRTTDEGVDVSAIARKSGGGGHRQAAGFPSEASVAEITDFIRREFLAQRAATAS